VEVVGIEYDEEGLGKHDGTHQGTRLFTCKHGHGSFVKTEKIERGVSIQRALAGKYFAADLPEAAKKSQAKEEVDAMDYTDSKGREKTMAVEFVGRYGIEQRQSRLEGFVEMALADSNAQSRYPEDIWTGDWSLPNLKNLWLDKTLVDNWGDVKALCELCPILDWLSLARTRMKPLIRGEPIPPPIGRPPPSPDCRLVLEPFACRVKTLVLTQTRLTWESLLAVDAASLFPCLENLHLASNGMSEGIPKLDHSPFPHLRTLILDDNQISDWQVLQRACATFPKLEQLHLSANQLGEASSLEGLLGVAEDQTPRRLTSLFLSENRFASWQSIGALSGYAVLELKAQRIPLTEGDAPLASPMLLRQVFIALMPTVLRLNASEVTVKERTAAERYVLGLAAQGSSAMVKALGETCDIAAHVSRLQKIHGDVVGGEVTEEAQAARSTLVFSLVEVTLRPVAAAILEQPAVVKKLPHTMTVGELRRLSQTLFKKVPLERVRLVLADPALPFGLPFEDDSRELGFYGVGDGGEIRVDDLSDHLHGKPTM